jgi:hypothetical protein
VAHDEGEEQVREAFENLALACRAFWDALLASNVPAALVGVWVGMIIAFACVWLSGGC